MTLFELVYICRLFGKDDAYVTLRRELGQNPDLASDAQHETLLQFLNKWGCRIKRDRFPKENLQAWAANSRLPGADRDIRSLTDNEREQVGRSYDALVNIGHRFKDTAAAKTLHAMRPRALPAWDQSIKDWFLKNQPNTGGASRSTAGQTYAAFIHHVAREVSTLEADANRLGYSLSDVPELVGKPDYSPVKLIDEHYWMTKTHDYIVPTRTEIEQWLRWLP